MDKARREYLVYYVLRDHFSGNLFFQIRTIKTLMPLAQFLYEGWRERDDDYLSGFTDLVSVPKNISSPALLDGLARLGVGVCHPPSGFASGIRVIGTLEEELSFMAASRSLPTLEWVEEKIERLYRNILRGSKQVDKKQYWRDNRKGRLSFPASEEEIVKAFPLDEAGVLPLINVKTTSRRRPQLIPRQLLPEAFSHEEYAEAYLMVSDLWRFQYRDEVIRASLKALKISPFCVNAYLSLAHESGDEQEKTFLYEKAVAAGRVALADLIKSEEGYFWQLGETRPYMHALAGLGTAGKKQGKLREAIKIFQEMLRLNPNDDQGVRYPLTALYLAEGMLKEARKLMFRYSEDESSAFFYNQALLYYMASGQDVKGDQLLQAAYERNPFIPDYLLEKRFYFKLPVHYGYGSQEEAIIYTDDAKIAWEKAPGALAWLQRMSTV